MWTCLIAMFLGAFIASCLWAIIIWRDKESRLDDDRRDSEIEGDL
jgi:hypothetical protein